MEETKVKYTVALPAKVAAKLEELCKSELTSKPEILRQAIALYNFVYKEVVGQKHKLCIVDKEDKILKEVVLF